MKRSKFGFTLIELLAVIIIFAVVLTITIPAVLNIIEIVKKEAFLKSGYMIVNAGKNYYDDKQNKISSDIYDLVNNNVIPFTGGGLRTGQLKYDKEGKIALAIWNGDYCVVKNYNDRKLTIVDNHDGTNCTVDKIDDIINGGATGYLCANPGSVVATEEKYFTFNQTTKTITGYSNEGPKDVIIPCTIGGVNVEVIGNGAFRSKSLTSVLMPDTIKIIGTDAFRSNQISTLELGNSIETINNMAFYGNKLTNLVLPDSLKSIIGNGYCYSWGTCSVGDKAEGKGYGTFSGNPLVSVTFGSGIETIGELAFEGIPTLTTVDFSRSTNLKVINDYAFLRSGLTNLVLPSVDTIGAYAFYYNKLASTTIPSNALKIGASAFQNNTIESLELNGTNLSIGLNAFQNNFIVELIFNGKIVSIGTDAFKNNQLSSTQAYIKGRNSDGTENNVLVSYGGANRSSIQIPDDITSVTGTFSSLGINGTFNSGNGLANISNDMFTSNALTTVVLGNNVKTIGSNAFRSNQISTLELGTSVETINNMAFYSNKLTNLILPDSLKNIIGNGYCYSWGTCSVGDKVAGKGYGTFSGNPLVSVTFGSGIETIGELAFEGIPTLTTVDFSKSTNLKVINDYAFLRSGLTNLLLASIATIGNYAFYYDKLTSVLINGSSYIIGGYAFQDNVIETLQLNGTITRIGKDAFKNNQLSDNQAFIRGRNLTGSETTTLVSYGGANRSSIQIPDDITSLSESSFSGLGLTGSLVIGNGITSIENNKFESNSLTSLTIGNRVTSIGSSAFRSNQISTLELGTSVETINNMAFYSNKLTKLVLPDSLKGIIGDGYCYSWGTCSVGDKVAGKGYGTFSGNPLVSITFGSGIETIGELAFEGISTLTTVDFSKSTNLKVIKDYAFLGSGLTKLALLSVETIGAYAFYYDKLTSITIPFNAVKIGTSAFASNASLDSIFIKGKVDSTNFTSLGSSWNGTCTNIIYELSSCYTYNNGTITGYESICDSNVEIPSSLGGVAVTAIADNAFVNKNLTRVVIPSSVTSIGVNSFDGNTIDPIIVLNKASSSDFASLGTNWNGGNPNIIYELDPNTCFKVTDTTVTDYYNETVCPKNITLPNGITKIADNAFESNNLDSVNLNNVSTIGNYAFKNNFLDTITISSNVKTIGNYPFSGNLLSSIHVLDGTDFISLGTSWNGNVLKVDFQGNSIEKNCYTVSGNEITKYQAYCPETVVIPTSVDAIAINSIGANAFKNSAVRYITVGSNILSIGSNAFENNDIATLSLVGGLQSIGNYAFNNTGLLTLSLPSTVMDIGDYAFANNSDLTEINVLGKNSAVEFTSLGTSWNGTCTNIIYLGN
jgi:prepilin-type N-terminal cleavage/methylation domain-containing protein